MAIKFGTNNITVVKHGTASISTVYHGSTKVFPDYQQLTTRATRDFDGDSFTADIYITNPNSFTVTIYVGYLYVNTSTEEYENEDYFLGTLSANSSSWFNLYTTAAEIYDFSITLWVDGNGYSWSQSDGWSD